MNEKKLRKTIKELQAEAQKAQGIDEKGKALLEQILIASNEFLATEGSKATKLTSATSSRFVDTIRHLEVTHPRITSLLEELLDILSTAGI